MPQIMMLVAPKVQSKVSAGLIDELGRTLIDVVEKSFGIEGKNDVAFDAQILTHVIGEADIQVEIRYTVGEDEYDRGEPFNPLQKEKEELIEQVTEAMRQRLTGVIESISVWPIPLRDAIFKFTKF